MDVAGGMGTTLGAFGASLALGFIVLLILGIAMLAAVYIASAVVVLDRFARVARRPGWMAFFALAGGLVAATVLLQTTQPELVNQPWSVWWRQLGESALGCIAASGIATLCCAWLMRKVDPTRLGRGVAAVLGLGIFLVAGARVPFGVLLAPLLVIAAGAVVAELRRRGRAGDQSGLHPLVLFAVAALVGSAGALLPETQVENAAGLGLLLVGAFFSFVVLGLLPLAAAGLVEMRRSVEWFIAIRYLVAKRRQVFISAISAICIGGIAAGVWLIIVVLSVMNGFERTWRDEILGNRAHFTVHHGQGPFAGYDDVLASVRGTPGVTGASPYLDVEGMVRGEGGRIFSVRLRGIDPTSVGDVTDLRDDLILGSVDDLVEVDSETQSLPGIVVGNQLAMSAGVVVGDEILLISPFGGPQTPLGPSPRLAKFRVVGIFQSSFFQYDEVYTYVSIPVAQGFKRVGDVIDGIEARTTDFYRSRKVGAAVREALGYPYFTRDWKDFFPAFFQALKSERVMMFLLLTMIMVVAAFLIVATLIMMIMEKSSDIAILKAMGAEDSTIERIFAIEGTLIGLMGTLIGVVSGIAVTRQLTWLQGIIEEITGIDTLPASVYQFSTLPTEVDPVQIGLVASIAMILSLGATLLPSRQGARLDPAEGLRYE